MREMRKSGRVFTRCQVVVKVVELNRPTRWYGPPRCGCTSDLSAEGIRIVVGEELPPGTTVELVLVMLEPPATFRHTGVVRWCKNSADGQKHFVGIELTASSPAVMQAWIQMLAERYPSSISKPTQKFAKDTGLAW